MKINSATVTPRYPWSCNDAVAQDIIRPVHPPPWRIWVTLLFDYQRSSLRIIRHALRHSSSHPRCGVLLIRLARDNSSSSIVSEFYSRYLNSAFRHDVLMSGFTKILLNQLIITPTWPDLGRYHRAGDLSFPGTCLLVPVT